MKLYLSKLLILIFYLVGPAIAVMRYECRRHYFTSDAVKGAVSRAIRFGSHLEKTKTLFGEPRYKVFIDLIFDGSGSAAFAIITRRSHKVKSVMVRDEEGQWETCSYGFTFCTNLDRAGWTYIPGATGPGCSCGDMG
ncbi:CSEP0119 putative effector protein [Blumeria hordei DH14]|uniref:CSEP0119 putative effector protein n=1 Tax=Blumeria graminis f. sp. hordei (strain DH14) TaxID=546991 RepID=N1JRE0_BLUG1|nr:CSEP0119 putative effector protein [Blumeria hordei DH14]